MPPPLPSSLSLSPVAANARRRRSPTHRRPSPFTRAALDRRPSVVVASVLGQIGATVVVVTRIPPPSTLAADAPPRLTLVQQPPTEERIAFGDITNILDVLQTTPLTPSNEELRKREAANRRQRECCARKKIAAITPCSGALMQPPIASLSMESEVVNARLAETTKDVREERNRKQREYRQRKKVGSTNLDGSVSSSTPVQPANEERNRKQREYHARKKAASKIVSGSNSESINHHDGVTQDETILVQAVHQDTPSSDYIEFDSRIFEPPLNNIVDEGLKDYMELT
uniref:Uncharacterized protein n=1 Tax=Oryza punctata TaxID=4537 RepID=A0A0E0M6D8_ORYPU